MHTETQIKLAPASDLREARQDWQKKAYYPASRDKQLAFAMVNAAVKNEQHPVAFQIGSVVKHMR